jgi:cob(I)alamin adenosyltransferase
MSYRLSKISTRTGDAGTTGLGDGSRVDKDHARVHALGDVDECNSLLGLLLCEPLPEDIRLLLTQIQHDLFDLGGELCIPGFASIKDEHVLRLEAALERYNAHLPPLANFILPGGIRAAALSHLVRTVARRAERAIITLGKHDKVSEHARQYINRLSDLMFVLARVLNCAEGHGDVLWQQKKTHESAQGEILPDVPEQL